MAEDIKLDENVTIRDAFKITGRDTKATKNPKTGVETIRANPVLKNIEKAGISLDSPFSVFQNEETSVKLAEAVKGKTGKGGANTFVELDVVENSLRTKYERRTKQAFPFVKVFGASGFLQKSPDLLAQYPETFKQPRRKDVFKGIPKAEVSLKNIAKGIAEITDADTRAAVAFNALVPLRPSEITSLKAEDIDFQTGAISEEWKRVNKIRNPVELPEIALSILKNQQVKGGEYLFGDVDANDMSAAVRKHVKPKFQDFVTSMGREIKGAKDFRKIIPSIIATELGQGKYVSQIMGHTQYDQITETLSKMTQDRYLSKILDQTGPSPKIALMALQNMYGEVLELNNVNELAGEFDLNLPEITSEGSPRINIIPKEKDIVSNVRIQGELTDEDLDLIEERRVARKAKLGQETSEAELAKVQAEIEKEKAKPELLKLKEQTLEQDIDFQLKKQDLTKQKREEKRQAQEKIEKELSKEELNKSKNTLREKLGNTKLFGKFLSSIPYVGTGVGIMVASERAEAEGKTPFEQAFYTASEVLPVSAYDIEDIGKFTAKAREEGIPEALGLDTERQEQMNIKRKERLAERSRNVSSANKQSSLDDQIQQLLSGR